MLSSVSRISRKSFTFAPSTARPTGTPCASVSRLRFVPAFARSVGFGPVFFPPEWRLGHRTIHGEPVPVDSLQTVVPQQTLSPELVEDAGVEPLPKAPVGRGARADTGGVQRVPLAPGPEHEEDTSHGVAIRNTRVVAAQRVLRARRQQRLQSCPERVWDRPTVVLRDKSHAPTSNPNRGSRKFLTVST